MSVKIFFCYAREDEPLLNKLKTHLRPLQREGLIEDWHGEPLGKLQALPKDGRPVTDPYWYNLDKAFYDVTTGIRKVVKQLAAYHSSDLPIVAKRRVKFLLFHHSRSINWHCLIPLLVMQAVLFVWRSVQTDRPWSVEARILQSKYGICPQER
jgi:hypothetical protein